MLELLETAQVGRFSCTVWFVLKADRQAGLLELLQTQGSATIAEIAGVLGVSPATVRRDLSELSERSLVDRTWGGVRLSGEVDDPFQEALMRSGAGKRRISRAALDLVEDGATVILDIGTTVHHVAIRLKDRDVTVLTASLPAFEQLRHSTTAEIVLLGGYWSEQYQCFYGPPVLEVLQHQQADLAFLGCSGVSDSGRLRDTSPEQVAVKRAIRAAATRAVLLADAGKFPGKGGSSPFALDALDGLITDATALPPALLEQCQIHELEVLKV